MQSLPVEITSLGIKKVLNKFTPEKAISEYIWNGFDANATVVKVFFEYNDFDAVDKIEIQDNGEGICYEELPNKFQKFYESQKKNKKSDLIRGKNGYGRFTFFKFSRFAKWRTTYRNGCSNFEYEISLNSDNLRSYSPTDPKPSNKDIGTIVEFSEVAVTLTKKFIDQKLLPFLKAEFAWFLELKEEFKIIINNVELDYTSIIEDKDVFKIECREESGDIKSFNCRYICWNVKMNDEYSRFYFLNNDLKLKYTKTTSLNKKGDQFWHSIIVLDDFFNEINCEEDDDEKDITNLRLFDEKGAKLIFKILISHLNQYLKNKRRPFLKKQANILIDKYEKEKVFPEFGINVWDQSRKDALETLVKELYEVEPAVFMKLNKEQKRIFLELLNLLMDKGESDSLFKILDAVVELDSADRKEFAKILETTRLKQVISTIQLISDRLITLESLKQIVFNHQLKANERRDLQTFVEKHYWIFGEEYRMVCAEEVKFEEALRRYIYILRGVSEKEYIDHPDKYKEMDLFLSGIDFRDGVPHNVIVEIKNPTSIPKLKSVHLNQLETYLDVILKQDCFNDSNEFWTFILIGQDYDDIILRRVQEKNTGLIQRGDHYALYVKKWSEIINEVERRLKYLLDKLKFERERLSYKEVNLDKIMSDFKANSAVLSN